MNLHFALVSIFNLGLIAVLSACTGNVDTPDQSGNFPPYIARLPDILYFTYDQTRIFRVVVTDSEQDLVILSTDGSLGTDGDVYLRGATFDTTTGLFEWTPISTDAGVYRVRFTATDNGSPSRSSSAEITLTVSALTDLGTKLYASICTFCHELAGTDLNTGCTVDEIKHGLYQALRSEPAMTGLQLGDLTGFTSQQQDDLTAAFDTDVDAVAQYLESVYSVLPYQCSIGNRAIQSGSSLTIDLFTGGTPGDYTIESDGTVGSGLDPYNQALVPPAMFDAATGVFNWTPVALNAGSYTVNFKLTEKAPPMNVVLNETISIAVSRDSFSYGTDLYMQYCDSCHSVPGLELDSRFPSPNTQSSVKAAIDTAINNVSSMNNLDTLLADPGDRSPIAEYLCSLPQNCN